MQEFYLQTDHACLHCGAWYPEGEPVGIVQLIHGVADHIARYDEFALFLASHGYLVVAEDHAGHGKTIGESDQLGYLDGGWLAVVHGIHRLYLKTHAEYPNVPYYMLGHSMGSFLLRTYLFQYETGLAGALISGTGWQNPLVLSAGLAVCAEEAKRIGERSVSSLLMRMAFGNYNRAFKPNRTEHDWVCSKEEVVDAYCRDPFCTFGISVQLCREMLRGIQMIQNKENLRRMQKNLPILFFAGQQDPVGAMGKGVVRTVRAFREAGMSCVDLRLYPGMRHEALNENGRERVYSDILDWLRQQ